MDFIETVMAGEAGDDCMSAEDRYYESLAEMEEYRKRTVPLFCALDELVEKEGAFRAEVRSHRHMANKVLRDALGFNTTGDERIDASGWSEEPFIDRPTFPEAG